MAPDDIEQLREFIDKSRRIVGFTGAGVSTDSGIPDYRSQGGIWDRYRPVYFQEFLEDEEKRLLYWKRKFDLWPAVEAAVPGPGHRFFADLYHDGKLTGLITQNIDGLHEKSGLPPEIIVNLHGTAIKTACLDCGTQLDSGEVYRSFDLADGAPRCGECGGLLKPATISFGQTLDPRSLERAETLAGSCDLLVAMGSTLVVYPAASLPASAQAHGAKLAVVTLSQTPYDAEADVAIHRPISEVVRSIAGPR
jgi:NAD-dependent deacetylase